MSFVPVHELAERNRSIDDPVLRGKVQKALHLLHRTLELYRLAAPAFRAVPQIAMLVAMLEHVCLCRKLQERATGSCQHNRLLCVSTFW